MQEETKKKDITKDIPKSNFVRSATVSTLADIEESLDIKNPQWELLSSYKGVVDEIKNELKYSSLENREKYYNNYMMFHFFFIPVCALFLTTKQAFGYGSLTIYFVKNHMPNNELNLLMNEPKTLLDKAKYKLTLMSLPIRYFFKLKSRIEEVTRIYE